MESLQEQNKVYLESNLELSQLMEELSMVVINAQKGQAVFHL